MTDIKYARKVTELAEQIKRYLHAGNENSAETLDGIAAWWIPQQRIMEERSLVESALSKLCDEGVLTRRKNVDGTVLYTRIKRELP